MYASIIELNMSPLFWLAIALVGGGVFCIDLIIEFVRLTYYETGSDYVRLLMQTKKGWGWNDENVEIEINQQDLDDIDKFMQPIEEYYRNQDFAREEFLNS